MGQDVDAKIKRLEELEARLDAKLERLDKLEKLEALQARVEAKLARLEVIDGNLESGLVRSVAARSANLASDDEPGFRVQRLAAPGGSPHSTYPTFEVFGGGQYSLINRLNKAHAFGWAGSATANFHRNIGVAADFGGAYGNTNVPSACFFFFFCGSKRESFSVYHLGIGPQLNVRDELLTAFIQIPFGFTHTTIAGHGQTDFALFPGAGLDINFGKSIAWRLLELDYMGVNSKSTGWTNSFGAKTGLVYRFGY